MKTKRRIHDGIAGGIIATGTALGYWLDPMWLLIPGLLGLTLLQSGFTGFCPVYFVLDRMGGLDGPRGDANPLTG